MAIVDAMKEIGEYLDNSIYVHQIHSHCPCVKCELFCSPAKTCFSKTAESVRRHADKVRLLLTRP